MHGPYRLIVFTRFAQPGKTKTRLIPAIGALRAAELHRRLTERTLQKARTWAGENRIDLEICYCGCDERSIRRWLGPGVFYRAQGQGDLGDRMARAFNRAFDDGCSRVLLIGTDVPGHDECHFQQAVGALDSCDLVLGPATDGGYWLIGLRGQADLLGGISWGTDVVFRQTLERAAQQQLSVSVLPALKDIDRPEDLASLEPGLRNDTILISVIIPTLNEAENIPAAIRSAQTDAVEIIVVDGGSEDETVARAESMGARVLRGPRGRACQMNRGAAIAQGQILLFLHADTLLPQGYAGLAFGEMLSAQTVGGGFCWQADSQGFMTNMAAHAVRIRTKCLREPWGDQAIFVKKKVFDKLGGFPEVPIAEDWHFMQALKRQGRIAAVPVAVITSGRRWQRMGLLRTLLVNQLIIAGCRLSIRPDWLAKLY